MRNWHKRKLFLHVLRDEIVQAPPIHVPGSIFINRPSCNYQKK